MSIRELRIQTPHLPEFYRNGRETGCWETDALGRIRAGIYSAAVFPTLPTVYYRLLRLLCASSWFTLAILFVAESGGLNAQEGCTAKARPDCLRAVSFFMKFQDAFHRNDQKTVANLVEYPLRTTLHGKPIFIRKPSDLLAYYDEVFDAEVRCALVSATQNSVWGNSRGFTIGVGELWFDGIIPQNEKAEANAPDFWTKYPFKIPTVNNGNPVSVCQQTQ